MKIPVVDGQDLRSGVKVVTGSVPVRILLLHARVPYRDALRKVGYQRKPQDTRVNRFATELKKGRTDVPTSILLNIRNKDDYKIEKISDYFKFIVFTKEDVPLYVVDGQHRVLAFAKLCEENLDKWGDQRLQFVLMLGADEKEEMNQFYIVNTTAKSVRTDLALDLLKQRTETDGRLLEEIIERGQEWKVEGQAIVDDLYEISAIWRRKIRLANADKGDTIIPAASFVTSLKSLLTTSPFFKKLTHLQRVRIIEAYWLGIREALREPFDGNPNNYALQKGIGVTAMHEILPTVVEIVRSSGESVNEPESYRGIMDHVLSNLNGDNTEGENVSGADFWLTAPLGGAAGSFSSSAGKRVLFAKLRTLLPEIEVE